MKNDIRVLVERLSGRRALRDRGDGLFVVEKPFEDARFRVERMLSEGAPAWRTEKEAENAAENMPESVPASPARFRVFPTPALLSEIEKNTPPDTAFLQSFARFRGETASEEAVSEDALRLFSEGVKLLEAPQKGKLDRFSRDVRALAALALRNAVPAGGLYALAVLLNELEGMK